MRASSCDFMSDVRFSRFSCACVWFRDTLSIWYQRDSNFKSIRFTEVNRDLRLPLKIRRLIQSQRKKEKEGEGKGRNGGQRFLISGALFLWPWWSVSFPFRYTEVNEIRKKEVSNIMKSELRLKCGMFACILMIVEYLSHAFNHKNRQLILIK